MGLFGSDKMTIGVDIGSSSVKIVSLKKDNSGKFTLDCFGEYPLPPEAIVDGSVMNTGSVVDAIKENLLENRIQAKNANISVSGNAVIIKRIQLQRMSFDELEEQIRWEAEQYIPYDIADVNIDVQIIEEDEDTDQMDVLLAAARKDLVAEKSILLQQAGLQTVLVDVDSFAISNTFSVNYETPPGTIALVNIGATATNIHILRNGNSVFTRDITLGGNQFTEEIQRTLNISYEEAERLKVGEGSEEGQNTVIPHEIQSILHSVCENVATEIQKTIDFYLSTSPDGYIDQIFLSGGGALTPGMQRGISQTTGIYTALLDPFRNISVAQRDIKPDFLENDAAKYVVAIGLAMRNHNPLIQETLPICVNLIPQKTSRRFEVVRRELNTALAGIAMVCMLLFAFHYYYSEGTDKLVIENRRLENQINEKKNEVETVKLLQEESKTLKEKLDAIDQLKRAKKGPVRMMDELATKTPEKLRMTTLSETEGRVKITGSAAAESDISKFLSSLESSDYFSNVLLNTIEQVEEEGIKTKSFSITARLDVPNLLPPPKKEDDKKK